MNNQPAKTTESFVDEVHFSRDAQGTPTGGKLIIRSTLDGKEIARFQYDDDGQEIYHTTLDYLETENGLEKTGRTFHPDGSLWEQAICRFNTEGELVEFITMNPVGEIIDRQIYTYTSESVHYSRFDEKQQLIESWSKRILP